MANKIRRDDEIIVLAGKDKGKQGKVLKVLPASNRLIVEGVSMIKKHQKFMEMIILLVEHQLTFLN